MPSAQVISYTAHVGRLGRLGADRLVVIRHTVVHEGEAVEDSSEIYFADRFGETDTGFCTLGGATTVRAHLPAGDYEAWIDLLRHEAPVYVHWTIADEPGVPEAEGIIHLATGPEPTGEGPVDLSG